MGTLYENIKSLCDEAGIKGGKMCVELGISKSTMTDLKSGRRTGISLETAQKIADYFGVSVNELLEGKRQQNSPPSVEDGLTEEQAEIVRLYEAAPLPLRAAALAVLKAAEEQGSVPDAAATGGRTLCLRDDCRNT